MEVRCAVRLGLGALEQTNDKYRDKIQKRQNSKRELN